MGQREVLTVHAFSVLSCLRVIKSGIANNPTIKSATAKLIRIKSSVIILITMLLP